MATIKDVAKHAGVSVATVSRVLNGSPQTRPGTVSLVKQAMVTLGYRPNAAARTLVSKKSLTIGVVVADVSDPFFGTLVKQVDTIAHYRGHQLLIGNGYHDAVREKQAIESLIQNQVGALIVHSKALDDDTLRAYAQELPAMVFINRLIEGLEDRCVYLDNYRGAYLATEHLIQQGHHHIAYIGSDHHIEDTRQRQQGYLDALTVHHLEKPNNGDDTQSSMAFAPPDEQGGETAINALLSRNQKVSAIFCYNDGMAVGVITALTDKGYHVPEDVSVIGFDDSLVARYLHPKLSTVRYPIAEMATEAAEIAISRLLHSETPAKNGRYQPILIKRDSVRNVDRSKP
ncbi:DNA-binding transcriptional regulator GalS [Enterovibrio norvegicus FF-454]|uniref:DNA-binding transcriptional regulator GalS n=2 Tax=Enterovibrio norvegicus TaxID=188144 RepID=A0A1E5BZ97_9GAMM|nr:substrate-binding domain-containing protein [Enterovibrio norvegicus]OEE58578.1 DNA-binding transcriptional regulator GalS [Enterovibrio norvegicus FF-454]